MPPHVLRHEQTVKYAFESFFLELTKHSPKKQAAGHHDEEAQGETRIIFFFSFRALL